MSEEVKKISAKRKKKKHPFRTFFSLAAIFLSCFLIWIVAEDLITTFRLKKEISTSEEMISSLESQQKDLKKRKENLEDPEYVKRYARGKFMVSKPGEQIFKLPSKSDDPANDGN